MNWQGTASSSTGKFILCVANWLFNKIADCLSKNPQPQSAKSVLNSQKLKYQTSLAWLGYPRRGVGGKTTGPTGQKWGPTGGASRSWACPAPRSEFFYLVGRAPNRPNCHSTPDLARILQAQVGSCIFPAHPVCTHAHTHRITGGRFVLYVAGGGRS